MNLSSTNLTLKEIWIQLDVPNCNYFFIVLGSKDVTVIKLCGLIKCLSYQKVKVLFLNQNDNLDYNTKDLIKLAAFECGLELGDVCFASNLKTPLSTNDISMLFSFSNVFICPYSQNIHSLNNNETLVELASKENNLIILSDSTKFERKIKSNIYYFHRTTDIKSLINEVHNVINLLNSNPHTKEKETQRILSSFSL